MEQGSPRHPKLSGPMLGVLISLLGLALFSISDGTAKFMTYRVSIPQIAWALYICILLVIPVLAFHRGVRAVVRTRHPWLQLTRSGAEVAGGFLFYMALHYLPWADVLAIGFIAPFLITALARVTLGEHVGPARWVACGIGFIGALVIIRPGFSDAGWPVILAVASAMLYAVYAVVTRRLGSSESAVGMLYYIGLVGAVTMSFIVPFAWVPPSPIEWVGLAVIGLFGAAAHLFIIRAYSLAPASLLAPFGYFEIIGAVVLGLIVFGDFPDLWTWVGTAVIIASGLFVSRSEVRLGSVTADRRAEAK